LSENRKYIIMMREPEHFKVRSSENRQYIIMMCEQENTKYDRLKIENIY